METTTRAPARASVGAGRPRRDGIDVARVLALVVVVAGHLAMAVVDRDGGRVRAANLLALRPGWAWVTALAPMPVFFAAGGWANATATLPASARRLRALVGVGAAVVAAWSLAVVVAVAVTGRPGAAGAGARLATQPLWFVAAYVPLAACGGRLARAAARHPVAAMGGCLAALAALDAARFALGAPAWITWPGFWLAWGTPWLAGAWWRARSGGAEGRSERLVGAALLVGAGGACVGLVALAGYSPGLIDIVPGARSNTTPPTLYPAVAGLAQWVRSCSGPGPSTGWGAGGGGRGHGRATLPSACARGT